MGKIGGFLEYDRQENPEVDPLERIKNFDEFHTCADVSERRCQAARCMDCGVPFCQSAMALNGMVVGCPLHNLIPEWNDAIYNCQDAHAFTRLIKTNPFPEFTGRVCPALCEKACINGCDGLPVTVHDNELYVIETAFKEGTIKPRIPAHRSGKKIAVIGSGPSGLAVADTLNKRGHSVVVFERDDHIGGLLMYGIPNMKLDKKVIDRRQKLMEEEGVVFKTNCDVGKDVDVKEIKKEFDAVVMCCGAKQPRALDAKGIDDVQGVRFAVDFLTEVTKQVVSGGVGQKLTMQVRDKNVVVVGGGDTGNDCIGTAIRLGAKSVTALEMMPKPPVERPANNPWPQWPKTLRTDYGHVEAKAVYGEDPRVFETTVSEVVPDAHGNIKKIKTVQVKFKDGKLTKVKGSEKEIPCDLLLIAAGFTGAQDYLPKAMKTPLGPRNTVATLEDDIYRTEVEGVFAAGDMRRGQSLVVWAIAEGKAGAAAVDKYLMGYTPL
ncbi:MAG: glutamate synthase subunit beta [Eubacterium sp.]|nr:glutamate synthase subunit beta [Eubacterium sp.]